MDGGWGLGNYNREEPIQFFVRGGFGGRGGMLVNYSRESRFLFLAGRDGRGRGVGAGSNNREKSI